MLIFKSLKCVSLRWLENQTLYCFADKALTGLFIEIMKAKKILKGGN